MLLSQVAFVSTEPVPPEFSRTVEFGNITYNIYSHSFLSLGQVNFLKNNSYNIYSHSFLNGKSLLNQQKPLTRKPGKTSLN